MDSYFTNTRREKTILAVSFGTERSDHSWVGDIGPRLQHAHLGGTNMNTEISEEQMKQPFCTNQCENFRLQQLILYHWTEQRVIYGANFESGSPLQTVLTHAWACTCKTTDKSPKLR